MVTIETDAHINGIMNRDESTYQELFQAYAKLLWTVAGGVLGSCAGAEQDIEECVSDAFITLWNHPEKYDPSRGSLKSYLCRIAKNKAIDIWRRKNKEKIVSLSDYKIMANTAATPAQSSAGSAATSTFTALYT